MLVEGYRVNGETVIRVEEELEEGEKKREILKRCAKRIRTKVSFDIENVKNLNRGN